MSFLRIFRLPRPDLAELRGVVDDLPVHVRIAMLDGIRLERVIAGAYTDGHDGVCPMLAAHRHGARYSHPDFARTWDEFAEAPVEGLRIAKPHHVQALDEVLRASIEAELRTPGPEQEPAAPARRSPGAPPRSEVRDEPIQECLPASAPAAAPVTPGPAPADERVVARR